MNLSIVDGGLISAISKDNLFYIIKIFLIFSYFNRLNPVCSKDDIHISYNYG